MWGRLYLIAGVVSDWRGGREGQAWIKLLHEALSYHMHLGAVILSAGVACSPWEAVPRPGGSQEAGSPPRATWVHPRPWPSPLSRYNQT